MIVQLTQSTVVNTDFITKIYINDYYEKYPAAGRAPITIEIHLNTISSIVNEGKTTIYSYDKVTVTCDSRNDVDDLLSKLAGVAVISQEKPNE